MYVYVYNEYKHTWIYVRTYNTHSVCLFCSLGQNVPVLVQHILSTVVHVVLGRGEEESSLSPEEEDENLSESEWDVPGPVTKV